jgi:hypothetical protein
MHRLRGKLTYANVVATIALFVALAGGTAFAATQMLPKNSVGPKQLRKDAVTPAKLAPATTTRLTGPKGATGSQGPKGDTGSQGPSGFTRGFQTAASTRPAGSLGTSLFGTTVTSIAVPPGNYLVTTNLEFTAVGGPGFADCRLINGFGGPESEAISRNQSLPQEAFENLSISGIFTVRAGQEMQVQCSRSGAATAVRVDDVNITAVQVQESVGTAF